MRAYILRYRKSYRSLIVFTGSASHIPLSPGPSVEGRSDHPERVSERAKLCPPDELVRPGDTIAVPERFF